MGLGKLVLRATLGGYFVGHGMQKLAGWFGGGGPDETGKVFEQAGACVRDARARCSQARPRRAAAHFSRSASSRRPL